MHFRGSRISARPRPGRRSRRYLGRLIALTFVLSLVATGLTLPASKAKPTLDARTTTLAQAVAGAGFAKSVHTTIASNMVGFDWNGKSRGTVYLQDFESTEPYSGISLFQPSYSPSNLRLGPGDVVDLTGTYEENNSKPVQFPANEFLIQVTKPQVSFRYEFNPPTPRDLIESLRSVEVAPRLVAIAPTTPTA